MFGSGTSATVRREAGRSRPKIEALAGVRILAALHIYVFHLKQAHDAGVLTFSIFARLPGPLANLIGRGYTSTGLFFQLSGFLLAYAYLNADGELEGSQLEFWKGRLVRLYPLYFLSLMLLAPAPALLPIMAKNPTVAETAAGVATSLTLTQAWFPPLAIWWNAPAWALSAIAAFYAIFPAASQLFSRLRVRELGWLVVALGFLAWLPAGIYLLCDPDGDALTATPITRGGFWLNALRFNPLTWVFQFLAGVALGRLFGVRADRGELGERGPRGLTAGDVAALAIILFLAFASRIPYVLLRHGLLAPLTLFVIADLARGRGLLSWALSWRTLGRVSDASFALFALQMPAGLWFCVATGQGSAGTTVQLFALLAWTLGVSILWSEGVQRPLLERLRKARVAEKAAQSSPHLPLPMTPRAVASRASAN